MFALARAVVASAIAAVAFDEAVDTSVSTELTVWLPKYAPTLITEAARIVPSKVKLPVADSIAKVVCHAPSDVRL